MKRHEFEKEYQQKIQEIIGVDEQLDLECKTAMFYEKQVDTLISEIEGKTLTNEERLSHMNKVSALMKKIMLEMRISDSEGLAARGEQSLNEISKLNQLEKTGQVEE
jgi:hypothetical protein